MTHTPIQKYRFFSIVWSIIYIFYAIVHIPILAVSLHFAPLVHLNTYLIVQNPEIIAFPVTNVLIILVMCALCIAGVLFSTKIRCGMCRVVSMVILGVHASLNILLILVRGAVIVYCIYLVSVLAKSVYDTPEVPTGLTSAEPTSADSDSYSFALVSVIIALFLMILSSITELIQVIFSSLMLHQIRLEDRKLRGLGGNYLKMNPTAASV